MWPVPDPPRCTGTEHLQIEAVDIGGGRTREVYRWRCDTCGAASPLLEGE